MLRKAISWNHKLPLYCCQLTVCRDSTRVSQSQRVAQQGPAPQAPSIKCCLLRRINKWIIKSETFAKLVSSWKHTSAPCHVCTRRLTGMLCGVSVVWNVCEIITCVWNCMGCCLCKTAQNSRGGVSWWQMSFGFSYNPHTRQAATRFSSVLWEFVYLLTGYQTQVAIGTGLETSTSPSSFIASHQSHRSSSDYWPVTRVSRKLTVHFPVSWPPLPEMALSTLVRIQGCRRKLSFSCSKVTSLQVYWLTVRYETALQRLNRTRSSGHMTQTFWEPNINIITSSANRDGKNQRLSI